MIYDLLAVDSGTPILEFLKENVTEGVMALRRLGKLISSHTHSLLRIILVLACIRFSLREGEK